jgi:hypothetical protein
MMEISHLLDASQIRICFLNRLRNIHIIFVTLHKLAQLLHIIQI